MYYAKLISGRVYFIAHHEFTYDVEEEISKEIYDYLKGNEQFELREVKKGKSEKEVK